MLGIISPCQTHNVGYIYRQFFCGILLAIKVCGWRLGRFTHTHARVYDRDVFRSYSHLVDFLIQTAIFFLYFYLDVYNKYIHTLRNGHPHCRNPKKTTERSFSCLSRILPSPCSQLGSIPPCSDKRPMV